MTPIGMKSSTHKSKWKKKNENQKPKVPTPSALEQCADTFYELCKSYGFKGPKNMKSTIKRWEEMSKEKGWIAFEKYKTAAFFSFHNDQEIPKEEYYRALGDNPAIFAGGNLYPFVRDLLNGKERMSFLTSVLYLKKGFPRPSADDLQVAELDTFKDLTDTNHITQHQKDRSFSYNVLQWGDIDDTCNIDPTITFNTIRSELQRTVHEVFHNGKYSSFDRSKAFMPSTSANYINSRAMAGAVGAIISDEKLLEDLRSPFKNETILTKDINDDEDSIAPDRIPEYILDATDQDKKFEKLWIRLIGRALQEDPDAVPLGLAEPLKTRVITKGPPYLYTVLKPLQKFMWKTMSEHPTFKLIGEPVSELNLWKQLGRELKDNEYYLSIDYANATNKLKSWVTEILADAVADELKLYNAERRLLKKSLIHHNIVSAEVGRLERALKSDLRKGKVDKNSVDYTNRLHVIGFHKRGKPQTNGQLMGSIMSFPFLCLANAAVCRMAFEYEGQRKIGLQNCPLLINGDDGLMKATITMDRVHTVVSNFIGLEPSIGKVYRSKKFFNINSTTFIRELHSLPIFDKVAIVPFRMVKYVNFGLIRGLKRSAVGKGGRNNLTDESDKYSNVSARAHELERFTPRHMYKKVFKQFVEHNLKNFHSIPWFLPRWIGGLGIPLSFGTPSELDLRLATRVLLNWKNERPVDLTAPSGWQIRQLAQRRAPEPIVTTDQHQGEILKDQYESLLGRLGIGLLFDSNIALSDLLKQTDEEAVLSKIRHNEKLWRMTRGKMCKPISMERLTFQRRYEGLSVKIVSASAQNNLKRDRILKIDLEPGYNDVSIAEAEWDTLV